MTAVLRGVTFLSAIFVLGFFAGGLDAQNAIPVECGTIVENQFTANAQIQDYSISLNPLDRVTIVGSPLGTTLSFNLSLYDPVGGFLVETDRGDVSATPRLASTELSSSGVFTISAANARYQYNRTLGERSTGKDSTWQGGIGVYTLLVSCVLRDGTVINAGGAQIPTEASVQPSPTETSETVSIGLTLFLDKDSLTLYVPPSDIPVSLEDLALQVALGDETQIFSLDEYAAFRGLQFYNLPTPICFRLVRSVSSSPVPGVCQGIPLILMQSVANADVFWFDPLVGEARLMTILQGQQSAGFCQSTQSGCEIEWTFAPVVAPTPIATATESTLTPTPIPQPTATPVVRGYPCEAAIVTEGIATVLRGVVRSSPSTSSVARGNVNVGQIVSIKRDRLDTFGGKWYEIANENGNTFGWIPAQYLSLSNACPN